MTLLNQPVHVPASGPPDGPVGSREPPSPQAAASTASSTVHINPRLAGLLCRARWRTVGVDRADLEYKGFEEWGHVLGDKGMAAALVDRLLYHCHIVNIPGSSYRMRQHQHWLRSSSEQQGK